ncbi:hypothetical protein EAI89_12990 [Eubacterium sp. am_0171]|nr:hypothetical protein EAI89_12990 [Eubacterium sp. am_0171]
MASNAILVISDIFFPPNATALILLDINLKINKKLEIVVRGFAAFVVGGGRSQWSAYQTRMGAVDGGWLKLF